MNLKSYLNANVNDERTPLERWRWWCIVASLVLILSTPFMPFILGGFFGWPGFIIGCFIFGLTWWIVEQDGN